MTKNLLLFSCLFFYLHFSAIKTASAQQVKQDSVVVKVHHSYNQVSSFHRFVFGENYRKEWSANTKLPVIRLSQIYGGLTPVQMGGGNQTKSLRLVDKSGTEWVLRSVEKSPEKLLPPLLQETFAKDWVNDAMSAQHPFSALIVPPLAEAAHVPHSNPIIGVVLADPNLGKYNKLFDNLVCLLEEREPTGKSTNTTNMIEAVLEDNDNVIDTREYLRARLLDLLIGDWDRHSDQWRWTKEKKEKGNIYTAVPRDRDQVFYTNQGLIPTLISKGYIVPNLQGFGSKIQDVRYSLWKTMIMDRFPASRFSYEEFMKIVNAFVAAETDSILESGLKRLPASAYKIRHDVLFKQLKERRNNIPAAMAYFYRFANKIIDIHTTEKNELVSINNGPKKSLNILINKISKNGEVKDTLMNASFHPDITKEIRIYVGGGEDHVVLNNASSPIKLRFIDSTGRKFYQIISSVNKVNVYDRGKKLSLADDTSRLKLHLSKDSANTSYSPVNLFNAIMPLANIEINPDEGLLLGLGVKFINQEGFRTKPYHDTQEFIVSHSFATSAFRIRYKGDWIHAVGNADFSLQAFVQSPGRTNFFGRGNETAFDKTGDYKTYYRTRYNTYSLNPALRWQINKGSNISIGPSFQYYHFNPADNTGRFINQTSLIGSYDSTTIAKDKVHAGFVVSYLLDRRNSKILTSAGSYLNVKLLAYAGLNGFSKSYSQLVSEFAIYRSLASSRLIIADRIGGGITLGKSAFYQSLFLGGQDNLLGYRQYRFAGQHMLYNNLEARLKLINLASYVLPGQLGLSGFFDAGRVWEQGENSDKIHTGTGGGIYFSPAGFAVVQVMAGHSTEGWYPFFSTSFRF
ncbi:MAG: hypothetical protein ACRYFL_04165 [Janthinobacterium lividum]